MKNCYYALLVLLLLTGCQWNLDKVLFDQPCVKPSASITAPTGTLLTNATLTFSLTNTQGDFDTATWDFGDGSATKTGTSVTYAYTKTGSFTVTATLSNRCKDAVKVTQSITIDSKDVPVFTISYGDIVADRARVTLTFSSTGKNTPISEFGLCYSATNNPPTIADNPGKYNATGATVGTPYSTTITGLTAGAVYYVRGYCKTDAPDPIYSPVVSFTTGVNIPVITTLPVSETSVDQAKINIQFTSRGSSVVTISEYGFCYSDTQNPPTIANNPTKIATPADPVQGQTYSQTLGGLTGGKTYYVRAYAKTNQSADPIYGAVQTFMTQSEPLLTTLDVTGVASQSAVFGAQVTNVAQFTPTSIGVCYSRTNNPPTQADETTRTTTNFQTNNLFNVTSLAPATLYYYRAFIILPSGAQRYGAAKQFTTTAVAVAQAPTVVTVGTVDVTATKANLVMKITAAPTALANYGIVYSKTITVPTLTNGATQMVNKDAAYVVGNNYAFITDLVYNQPLDPNTKYYFRGYATTIPVSGSALTAYGDVQTFTTLAASSTFTAPEVVAVAGGTFTMGTDVTDKTKPFAKQDGDEGPAHTVTLSAYSIGKYEVTVKQYRDYATANSVAMPTFTWTAQDTYPISNITYANAVAYCAWLSKQTGKTYRLPTEAEWEYAARGGSASKVTAYAGSATANTVGWNKTNITNTPSVVGKLAANELGIYDMSGNVWEIVNDLYSFTYYTISNGTTNPPGPTAAQQNASDSGLRVKRGGSFAADAIYTSVIERGQIFTATPASGDVGFRVVLQP